MTRSTLRAVVLLIVTAALSVWVYDRSLTGQPSLVRATAAPPSASDPQMRVQLRAWLTDSEPMIDALVIARNNITAAAGRRDVVATSAACRTASGAVADLRRRMPSPDPMLNSQFLQAISDYDVGLPSCMSGGGMQQAAIYITAADAAMHAAFDILGHVPGCEPGEKGVLIV
ncbi:hypothetical protein [Mycobacterium sp.]|uniref:hypothetical protein n=1 Tax=Mycobacterium sp. TaxID=1785 RepID=UPI003C796C47